MQYHNNVDKSLGHSLYQTFVDRLEAEMRKKDACSEKCVRGGTYGNRQILSVDTNGPYTHLVEVWVMLGGVKENLPSQWIEEERNKAGYTA